ncbi:MAG: NADH-quinone oxidoreductase subunit C [Chloroflexi bacterium]|nr:NADH-quinone oxidoreductase subunit C [Chloroflexota bacterium]
MDAYLTDVVMPTLQQRLAAEPQVFRGEVSFVVPPEGLAEAARLLRDELDFDALLDLTAVDYWPEGRPRFQVIYQFYSYTHNVAVRLRVPVEEDAAEVPSLVDLYPSANWYEREVWDMFGIRFAGHPDLRRILMPYDWVGHPLRKDYPLGYEEPQFTFNFDDIERRKPRPRS